jgi:hypothetical protein
MVVVSLQRADELVLVMGWRKASSRNGSEGRDGPQTGLWTHCGIGTRIPPHAAMTGHELLIPTPDVDR